MRKMAAIVLFASAAAFALASPAQARHHHYRHHHVRSVTAERHITCNRFGCSDRTQAHVASQRVAGRRVAGRRAGSSNCPRNLGCGCNLANYFHIIGKKWRELWVARNWARVGSAAAKGCTGCVAVLSRGRGGHVGVVRSYDANGNPVIYSYANGRLGWTTAPYSKRRVLAYRSL
jgi:hypothetical protein